ncbi:transposase [Streptococcus pneumoniae]|nr:transposase [Streptococcus pneumoniae]CVT52270.1 transposase [Streptococcus pneumoniae]
MKSTKEEIQTIKTLLKDSRTAKYHKRLQIVLFCLMGKSYKEIIELLCEEFGHKLLPLPPYSPEYNPIEKTWAHIKKHLIKGITKLLQYLLRGSFVLLLFQLTIAD